MEVAAKRPPEKVMVLRQPSSPAAGSDSSSKSSGRPPVPPPKPTASPGQAVFGGPSSPAAVDVANGPSFPVDQLDVDTCDALPPPPSEDELYPAAADVPSAVDLSLGIKPDASASVVASVAISRIASKYDTSANATRARLTGMTATTTAVQPPSLSGADPSSDPADGGSSICEANLALLASHAASHALAKQGAAGLSDAAADRIGGGSPVIARPTLPPPPPPPPTAVELVLPAPPSDFANHTVTDDGCGSAAARADLLSPPAAAASVFAVQSMPEIAVGQRSRASSTDSALSCGRGRSGVSPHSSDPSASPGAPLSASSNLIPTLSVGKSSLSAVARIASESSSRSCTPPVADSECAPAFVSAETVAVKLTQLKIENKRNNAVPRHDVAGDGKKVSFRVDDRPGGLRRSYESGSTEKQQLMDEQRLRKGLGSGGSGQQQQQQLMDEQRLRTGLSADEVMQAEVFYRSHKTEVRVCQCMATLFFAEVPPPASPDGGGSGRGGAVHVSVEDWKPSNIGIPLLVYDSGEGKRQRALAFVFAERGTGFQLWRNTMHWLTDYRPVETTFHQMRVGPPPATPRRKKSSKSADGAEQDAQTCTMAGLAFQDGQCAEQFFAQYKQLVEWRPDDNILGDPSLKKKKKKNGSATAAGTSAAGDKAKKQPPLPSKTAISQPVEFAHITQLKRSEDGLALLPTVCPTESYRVDEKPAVGTP